MRETQGAKGAARIGKPRSAVPQEYSTQPPPLHDLGLTRKEASTATLLASLPQETFEAVKAGQKTITEARRQHRRDSTQRKATEWPAGTYHVLYADPLASHGNPAE